MIGREPVTLSLIYQPENQYDYFESKIFHFLAGLLIFKSSLSNDQELVIFVLVINFSEVVYWAWI